MRPWKPTCSIKREENHPGGAEECLIMRNSKHPPKMLGPASQGAAEVVSAMEKGGEM